MWKMLAKTMEMKPYTSDALAYRALLLLKSATASFRLKLKINFDIEKGEHLNSQTSNSIEITTVNIFLVYFMTIYDRSVHF